MFTVADVVGVDALFVLTWFHSLWMWPGWTLQATLLPGVLVMTMTLEGLRNLEGIDELAVPFPIAMKLLL